MDLQALETTIENAWENRDSVGIDTKGEIRDAVEETLLALDGGSLRVAEKGADGWMSISGLRKLSSSLSVLTIWMLLKAAQAKQRGGIKYQANLTAGALIASAKPVSEPYLAASSVAPRTSRLVLY